MKSSFREMLVPLRARVEASRTSVRPISRVSFGLSDKAAFQRSIELCFDWMKPFAGVSLPAAARAGSPFDVSDELGANPCRAVRIDAADGAIWAARLDNPDIDTTLSRTWVTELFVEQRRGSLTRFGAQLTCISRGDNPPFDITRPRVVRDILARLSAEADGLALSETPTLLERGDVPAFEKLLYNPDRRLPVIAVSEDDDGSSVVSGELLARRIAGSAHIYRLPPETAWELTRTVGKQMSVFKGAARIYSPGLTEENEDPYQHPLWLQGEGRQRLDLVNLFAARLLPAAFLSATEAEDFPRFSIVREASARRENKKADTYSPDQSLAVEVKTLKQDLAEAVEEREEWEALARDYDDKRVASEAERERLKEELKTWKAKAYAYEQALESKGATGQVAQKKDRRLSTYDDLEDWAEEVLGDRVTIHAAAVKDCRKNGHDSMLEKIEKTLIVIRDYVVPARREGGLPKIEAARVKLAELGMEDTACFADREEAKRTTGYSVPYGGHSRVLYDHFKYGNGYDNANQVRIYYFWDEEDGRLVVGKMPTHLKNNMTN